MQRDRPLPTEGELVIATIEKVFDYGSYVKLDEYGDLQAYLPWGEVANKWVRNIRNVIQEGQKVVVKVIRVDRKKGAVDVSLKKVNDDERRRKLMSWKREQKATRIIEIAGSKIGKSKKEAYQEVIQILQEKYGDIMKGLEMASKTGGKSLVEIGIPEIWVKPLTEEASKHTEERRVKVSKTISIRSPGGHGVEDLKKVIGEALTEIPPDYKVRVYTIGAPKYRIDVVGPEAKEGLQILEDIIKKIKGTVISNKMDFKVLDK